MQRRHDITSAAGHTRVKRLCRGCGANELFLFRLIKEATDGEIRDFVDDETMNVGEIECMSQEHYYTKSYRIVLQGNDLDRVYEPEIWPEGVCCRRFRKTREQDGK